MIDFIKGYIVEIGSGHIVIENKGMGYRAAASTFTISDLNQVGDEVLLYTHMIVREDDISLCGFSTHQERTLFRLLTSVSGVGTKVAVGILSTIHLHDLASVIVTGDVTRLTKAPGVGKKTAQRIILELKDKIDKQIKSEGLAFSVEAPISAGQVGSGAREALEAMLALGYTQQEAEKVLTKIDGIEKSTEDIIKEALRLIVAG